MAKLNESDFKKKASDRAFSSLYLIYGEEKYMIKHYLNYLTKKITSDNISEFNFHNFYESADISDIISATQIIPFMSEYNCVRLIDFDFDDINADEMKAFLSGLESIDKTSILIIAMPTLALNKKSTNFKKLSAFLEKNGTVLELAEKSSMELERQVMSWANKTGCSISKINAGKIVSYVGNNLVFIKNELEKLCAFANGNEITLEMIELLVTKNLTAKIFKLAEFVMNKNTEQAYRQLNTLFYQREEPIFIVKILGDAYIDAYRARVASESGISLKQVAEDFEYKNRAFVLEQGARNSRNLSTAALRESLKEFLKTDIQLKSTSCDAKLVVEKLIASLIVISNK